MTFSTRADAARHVGAAILFLSFALGWTFPLAVHVSTHLPGAQIGDNVTFLWNVWWMRGALHAPAELVHTSQLFVPVGTDLTLHTHTALPAFIGATAFGAISAISALNLTILVSMFLNGFSAYLLAWRVVRDWSGAIVAGLVFGGSPFIAGHLSGHFNLTNAWPIPLFALAASEAVDGSSVRRALLAGPILGATAFVDYYYVVYGIALAAVLVTLGVRDWSITRGEKARRPVIERTILALVILNAAIVIAISATGGFVLNLGPVRLSMQSAFNPRQTFWLLFGLWLLVRIRPAVRGRARSDVDAASTQRSTAVMLATFLVVASPVIIAGIALVARGDYVTQRYLWRSAPKGVDLATLFVGHPFHASIRDHVGALYAALRIDAIESSAWLGIAPVLLALLAIRRGWTTRAVRCWTTIAGIFFLWALGPHLMVFGRNTGMILPQTALRYIPIVSNARIPGRAMIVVFLALAVLAAFGMAEWRRRSRRPALVSIVSAAIVIVEFAPVPVPLVALERPAIYDTLRTRPEPGGLCELPMGLRDGFGSRGFLDDRVLFYQTIHGRPMTGGFVARLSPSVVHAYDTDPLLSALLRLSAGDSPARIELPDPVRAAQLLEKHGIQFVMLNRATALPPLIDFVEHGLRALTPIAREGTRTLYLVSSQVSGAAR